MTTPEQLPLPFTITISLTKGYRAVVDAIDADLAALKWTARVDKNTCYATRNKRIDGRKTLPLLHRIILSRALGRDLAKGEIVDHIDGNGLNNRRENLRLATHFENMQNQRMSRVNTSGFKGVYWKKNREKWVAQIQVNGKRKYLGLFDTPELAYDAYCQAATEYYGEFANFGSPPQD